MNCSFCNKTHQQVRKLIAGPDVSICDECVDICLSILVEQDDPVPPPVTPEETRRIGYVTDVPAHLRATCSLCTLLFPLHQALVVRSRGYLCPGCVGAVQGALGSGAPC